MASIPGTEYCTTIIKALAERKTEFYFTNWNNKKLFRIVLKKVIITSDGDTNQEIKQEGNWVT